MTDEVLEVVDSRGVKQRVRVHAPVEVADHDPIADLELLLAPPPRLIGHDHGFHLGKQGEFTIVEDPVAFARIRNARRAAAQRLADAAKLIRVVR